MLVMEEPLATMAQTIEEIIAQQKLCIENAESHKRALVEYIRSFVEAKRGNQRLLANESGVPEQTISNLLKGNGFPPGMEKIIQLAEIIKNY